MPRVTRDQINRRLSYLNGKGLNLRVDKDAVGFRLMSDANNRYISPRLPLAQMIDWLEAFETGYEVGKEAGINDMRKNRVEPHIEHCDCDVCDMVRRRKYREKEEARG